MSLRRRDFVRVGTAAAVLGVVPRTQLLAHPVASRDQAIFDTLNILASEDEMRTLALRAVDAARSAGAEYADVRLTRTVTQEFAHREKQVRRASVKDRESFGFGVRALVNGYWGFAASPYWEAEEAPILAKNAVNQCKANALGSPRVVEWGALPAATGSWVSPGIDPFSISIEEKIDFMNAWRQAVLDARVPGYTTGLETAGMRFGRQEWLMASTEGTVISQLFYDTSGKFPLGIQDEDWLKGRQQGWLGGLAKDVHPQRGGWDVIVDAKIRDQIPGITEEIIKNLDLSARPVEVGRYEVVFDAASVADLLTNTIGLATQLDRAIGLEANSGGTSYLGPDPMEFLGTMPVGSPLLNVSGNRSMPKGTATVKWDDEGVMPDEFPLITNGRLVDFQTTREQAPWLKSWYQREQRAVQSHGCARSTSALFIPLQQLPNLVMQPAAEPASFESMVAGVKRGYAIFGGRAFPDFQAKNVSGTGGVREIINGRLGDVIHGAGFLFNSMEFWKSVTAVGGASSVQQVSSSSRKGQPTQSSGHHVSAVPITVKNLSIIDMRRRA